MAGVTKIYDARSALTGNRNEIFREEKRDGSVRLVSRRSITSSQASVIMDEVKYQSEMCNGGMAKNHKQMGIIPGEVFFAMHKEAQEQGRELTRKDYEKYFAENPAFRINKV